MRKRQAIGPEQLLAYADGRLDAAERAEVEAHLERDKEAAGDVAVWQRQNEALAALFPMPAGRTPERLSPHLLARRQVRQRPMALVRAAAAAVLLLALGSAAGWLAHDFAGASLSPADRLVARATVAHTLYTRENRHAVEVAASDEPHLLTWLSNRLGTPVMAPDLSARGFSLVGGRLLPPDPEAGAGPAAQLMYENAAAERLTVYVTPALPSKQRSARVIEYDGLEAFNFTDAAITCTIVGKLSAEQLRPIATQIYQELSRAVDPPPRG